MMTPEALQMLRCPETLQRLQLASDAELAAMRQRISAGDLKNRAGKTVTEPFEGGLVREDRKILYPIRLNIPVLLIEEGIPLDPVISSASVVGRV